MKSRNGFVAIASFTMKSFLKINIASANDHINNVKVRAGVSRFNELGAFRKVSTKDSSSV